MTIGTTLVCFLALAALICAIFSLANGKVPVTVTALLLALCEVFHCFAAHG